jgi:hypothetical protein
MTELITSKRTPVPANHLNSITSVELEGVSGGASTAKTWTAYVASQRAAVAPQYKDIVCAGAGVKGGATFATQVYGADRTTDADKIRAAQTLQGVCLGGDRLPEAAPQTPF